jgi:16S rRNA (cytosine967-C5)-methyltransferase
MRPAGRLQAAIEVLENHAATTYPARLVLSSWARSNRFAGSKDRAAIANLVFDVLRRSSSYAACMGSATPRALVLAAFLDGWGYSLAELDELCDGGQYAPQALSDEEKDGLGRLQDHAPLDVSPAALADIPAWLYPSIERAFGEHSQAEGQALAKRAPIDLRTNRLKVKRSTLLNLLIDLNAKPFEALENTVRIEASAGPQKSPRLDALDAYRRGWFEVQDAGSQVVSILTGVKAGMQVLDLCAGSGGKTLAMAMQMENKGQVHAYDAQASRLAPIAERLQRAGVHNVRILPSNNQGALDKLNDKMDVVLVDAPCTGSGTWRRKPDSKWRLTREQLEERLGEQRDVLEQGAKAVKAGGRLVYVTCSILPEENVDQVAWFLDKHDGFSLVPHELIWGEVQTTPAPTSAIEVQNMLQMTPAHNDTDGFFIAILQKNA